MPVTLKEDIYTQREEKFENRWSEITHRHDSI